MPGPPTEPTRSLTAADLPDGFRLGTATSSYQIEGSVHADGRGPSIWDRFAQRPGAIVDGDSGDPGCDHYNRWEQDLDLLAELGVDAYRFSIAWPRIQPTGRGTPLGAGLDFYDRLVDGLLARGIEPWPTLYHWDLPAALEEDLGGWQHRDVAGRFADYAGIVAERLGDRVARWATLNEPWVIAWLGYERGVFAPGVADEAAAVRVHHHLLLGHGMATQAVRAAGPAEVGIVCNMADVRPASDRPGDVAAAELVDVLQNRCWLEPLAGRTPDAFVEIAARLVEPETLVRDGDAATIAQPLDWFGVNFYQPMWAEASDDPARRVPGPGLDGIAERRPGDVPSNMLGWPIDASGLTNCLQLAASILPDTPIAVTENGIPLPDEIGDDGVHDPGRVAYLQDHLAAALDAREAGVPLDGYLVWSLLDNFEWAEGYGPRFGIVHVDYDTQVRTPKTSYRWLQELLGSR